jgi:hypothetical protein
MQEVQEKRGLSEITPLFFESAVPPERGEMGRRQPFPDDALMIVFERRQLICPARQAVP